VQAQNQMAMSMAMHSGGLPFMQGPPPTRVVSLLDVVDVAELTDDVAFTEIMEDMQDECGKYGKVLKLLIPRPQPDGSYAAGVGKVRGA
jgi:splicing factor U2AF subunit